MEEKRPLLKDELFNAKRVHKIASEIKAVYPLFEQERFESDVNAGFPQLELKERMVHIAQMLKRYLPVEYPEAVGVILDALPEPLDENKSDNDFGDFIYASYAEYIREQGCNDIYLQISIDALREITKRFSVEYAIRDFINHYPNETLAMLESCSLSTNYHERRLASEALRPKLPWAKKLTIQHETSLYILNNIYFDKARFVTRSVANHLNDLSKIDPDLVISLLHRWKREGKQNQTEMTWMIKHALRTLIKQGHSEALSLLGYQKDPKIKVEKLSFVSDRVAVGESLGFVCDIIAHEDVKLLIDYVVHFQTKTGKLNPKVFKIKKYELMEGELLRIEKQHPFKLMSTRRLYAGEHKVELQINGKVVASKQFVLIDS